MKILIISPFWPWCNNTGASQRARLFTDSLADIGEVDFLAFSDGLDPCDRFSEYSGVRELKAVMFPDEKSVIRRLLTVILGWDRAEVISAQRACVAAAREMQARRHYDLVLYIRELSWLVSHRGVSSPGLIDVDDFRDVVLQRWLDAGKDASARPLTFLRRVSMRRGIKAARSQRAKVMKSGAKMLVVSETDAARIGGVESVVIPNVYPRDARPGVTPLKDRRNILTFIGLHLYSPNVDGAIWFSVNILPIIAQEIPDVEFKIVGAHDHRVEALKNIPHVTVTGSVENAIEQLDEAKVVVVPLRVGGGSRIKILEAMACGVPVVSTTIGAEGIQVEAGRHAFVADGVQEFAEACIVALRAGTEVVSMVNASLALIEDKYSPSRVSNVLKEVAQRTVEE